MLMQRVLTAVLLAPLAIAGILLLDTPVVALWFGALLLAALYEWSRLVGQTGVGARVAYGLAGAGAMVALWILRKHGALELALAAGVAWWLIAPLWLRAFTFAQAPTPASATLKLVAGMLIVVPAWAAALLLHAIPEHGPWWVLLVLLLVWGADTGAYVAGRSFGKKKLAPRISPGKTWAGVYGALLASAALAALGGWWFGLGRVQLALLVALALVTVVFSIVGDLFESLIKRHANVKDSGSIFPGHGGFFDRLDSLFAALPVFAAGKILLGI